MLAIPWPLCQALQQVQSVQVVQQVQGVHGLQDHQKLLAFQAHPEEKWEKRLLPDFIQLLPLLLFI